MFEYNDIGDKMQTYIVKKGDTLYGISNQYGVSAKELADLNNVTPETLKVGQELKIPTNQGTNPSNMFLYTVKKGDSLYNIAKKYNTTVKEIIALNGLKNTNLSIGQQLRIPQEYNNEIKDNIPTYISYTVLKGDSLYSIAKKYNTNPDTIMKDNGLTNTSLNVGQVLKIRTSNQEVLKCIGEEYNIPAINQTETINYVVKKGDNLYNIAKTYNTSVNDIINTNNLSNSNLSIGQVLKIPKPTSIETTYTVKKGDTLYSIAKLFNTTPSSIINKNNLKTNVLSIGQVLKI